MNKTASAQEVWARSVLRALAAGQQMPLATPAKRKTRDRSGSTPQRPSHAKRKHARIKVKEARRVNRANRR